MISCAEGSTKTPTEQVAKKKDVKKYGMPLPLHVGEQRLPDALEAFFKGEPERKKKRSLLFLLLELEVHSVHSLTLLLLNARDRAPLVEWG